HPGLAVAFPTDLLDAVVQLVGVPVGIVEVGVPVGAGHVAAGALDGHAALFQPGNGLADLAQAAYLPGDLIDGHAWREAAARVERFADPLVEHHEGVVVAAVMHEETARVAHAG